MRSLQISHCVKFRIFAGELLTEEGGVEEGKTKKKKKRKENEKKEMGYLLRVRITSFLAGAAMASAIGIYAMHHDYQIAHQTLSQQTIGHYHSLEGRISALEKSQEVKATKPVEAAP
ncbi:hypothetical protein ACH5RR_041831 [Cinchona calisaya]|uniref:Uncharacterized protein n=1 Tax=Cinchona calisaya TaxID=153742 RepID=A0ABD2Y0D7_9GENT